MTFIKHNIFGYHKTLIFSSIFLLLIFVLSICFAVNVFSANIYGLEAIPYEAQEQNDFLDNIKLRLSASMPTNNSSIVNMDVSKNGYVAIALENRSVMVYDDKGVFLKKFEFESYGSYHIKWNKNNLTLFYVRENSIIEFTLDCEIIGVFYIDSSSTLIREIRDTTKASVDSDTYEIKNKLFFGGYTTLVKTDKAGNEIILYSSNASSKTVNAIFIVLFVLGFTIIPCVILSKQVKYIKCKKQHYRNEYRGRFYVFRIVSEK